jgi:hypothetical protein
MIIDDVLIINNVIAVSGSCKNKNDFTQNLIDDFGIEYKANIPFIKYLTRPDDNYIMLELKNVSNPDILKGLTLKSA